MANQEKIAAENKLKAFISKLKTEDIQYQVIALYKNPKHEAGDASPYLLNELAKRMGEKAFLAFEKRLDELE